MLRVFSEIRPVPRITWLTVASETPASEATVLSLGFAVICLFSGQMLCRIYLKNISFRKPLSGTAPGRPIFVQNFS
jgi:hypothetical protein